jgi:hypothetical protein
MPNIFGCDVLPFDDEPPLFLVAWRTWQWKTEDAAVLAVVGTRLGFRQNGIIAVWEFVEEKKRKNFTSS